MFKFSGICMVSLLTCVNFNFEGRDKQVIILNIKKFILYFIFDLALPQLFWSLPKSRAE